MSGRLTALQTRVVEVLAGLEPAWTLSGGAALAGVHLKHRRTRDLDLFWHGREGLGRIPDDVARRLTDAGLQVAPVQRTPGFSRFTVTNREEHIVLDLVAEPVPYQEAPVRAWIGPVEIWIDTPHEILVNKLCSLLGRSEIRDLIDLRALLGRGADLELGMKGAAAKDGGFSALTLAWVLEQVDVARLAASEGLTEVEARALAEFRDDLSRRLTEERGQE